MIRVLKTGKLEPTLGDYRYVTDFKQTIAGIEAAYYGRGQKMVDVALDLETLGLDEFNPNAYIISIQISYALGKSDVLYFASKQVMVDWMADPENRAQADWLRLGRLAARYEISVDQLWEIGDLGTYPALTNIGWLLFPPMDEHALCRLARLTHVGIPRLAALQTPMAWASDRDRLPYCFDCLVLNPVDVFSPRWKQDWLDPHTAVCQVPGHRLNTAPASTLRICRNLSAVLRELGKRQPRVR
ncbi:hypothetical protein D8I24_7341 [Cupriavidus necator H850]|nr:hypothetical protein D8I24_7341 [Cupriavidus necator H850]